ncbi:MAG: hypothetical protein NTY48_00070 [Candidatus Diapherotrites archaeon]|nr:hypothetical protein [Candidatus Diapherotrites archaeon]
MFKLKEPLCSNDFPYFDYQSEKKVAEKMVASKSPDFNASGLCTSSLCMPYLKQKMVIDENLITVEGTEYVDFNINGTEKMGLGYSVPKSSTDFKLFFENESAQNMISTSQYDFNSAIPLKTQNSVTFTTKSGYFNLKGGRNIISYKYSYTPQKGCADGVCIYPVIVFAYLGELVDLEIISNNGKILNDYRKTFNGTNEQMIAVSKEPTFTAGKFIISESQRNFYLANDKSIERVSDNASFAENLVSQKTTSKIFLFFTDVVSSDSSFTYNSGGVIVIQGGQLKDEFEEVLMHELTHTAVTNYNLPNWLNEGIAFYLGAKYIGGEIFDSNNNKYIITNADAKQYFILDYSYSMYNYSALIVKNFIEKYGCTKFKQFLKELDSLDTQKSLERQRVEQALNKTIGKFTYEDLVGNKI